MSKAGRQFVRTFCAAPKTAAAHGETVTQSITTTDAAGTMRTVFKKISLVKETWSNLSRTARIAIGGYITFGALDMFYGSYNGGKSALETFRGIPKNDRGSQTEWEAVKDGCSADSFERFFAALFWPTDVLSKIAPHIVIALNPDDKSAESPKPMRGGICLS